MTNIERCNIILTSLIGESLIEKWWDSPNKAFQMMTPKEQWNIDQKIVMSYLYGQLNGDYH